MVAWIKVFLSVLHDLQEGIYDLNCQMLPFPLEKTPSHNSNFECCLLFSFVRCHYGSFDLVTLEEPPEMH
ncbi:hypothetical protein NPIL_691691 [Nephila pilipes]|uniref:Uncharacterized protein n=1 Tax=Nephila pilipes TaxID=299642 RepID=A0A8X6J3R5_NEPPI|nr:hypothetical protein NPIL_691691 [Nephila pilipes]